MLLLYRVEGLNEAGDWETIRVCRLAYLKTEIVEIERYGLFNLRKRKVVVDRVIHNEKEAEAAAWDAAQKYYHRNEVQFKSRRITVTSRVDGVLKTVVIRER